MHKVLLVHSALQVVRQHDSRLFALECAKLLLERDDIGTAIALLHADAWWEQHGVIGLRCQSQADTLLVRAQHRLLAQQAAAAGLTKLLLGCVGSLYTAQIPVSFEPHP